MNEIWIGLSSGLFASLATIWIQFYVDRVRHKESVANELMAWVETLRLRVRQMKVIRARLMQVDLTERQTELHWQLSDAVLEQTETNTMVFRVVLLWGRDKEFTLVRSIQKACGGAASLMRGATGEAADWRSRSADVDELLKAVDQGIYLLGEVLYRESFPMILARLRGEVPSDE